MLAAMEALRRRLHGAPRSCAGLFHLPSAAGPVGQVPFVGTNVHAAISRLVASVAPSHICNSISPPVEPGPSDASVFVGQYRRRKNGTAQNHTPVAFDGRLRECKAKRLILLDTIREEIRRARDLTRRCGQRHHAVLIHAIHLMAQRFSQESEEARYPGDVFPRKTILIFSIFIFRVQDEFRFFGQREILVKVYVAFIHAATVTEPLFRGPLLHRWE
mmetsp:Transcript_1420/g.3080  ORF Transcript_1420/g.3080 Transcript_1420/m.3080 type:complete len:217 (-) Transcript_1420:1019-1669(-)